MMNNIVSLVTPKVETNQECIQFLEDLLERVKDGEIVEVSVACILNDGSSFTGHTVSNNAQAMIGAIEIIKHKFLKRLLND